MPHLLIVGGGDAGVAGARRAREVAPDWEITLALADAFPNFSICGLPYLLSGEVPRWRDLAHSRDFDGIRLMPEARVVYLSAKTKRVVVRQGARDEAKLSFDSMILATGSHAVRPPIEGADKPGVHVLHDMIDGLRIERALAESSPKTAVIVGAGYIGLEVAEALAHRGLAVTVLARRGRLLPTMDSEFGGAVRSTLERHGVTVRDVEAVAAVAGDAPLQVVDDQDHRHEADLVMLATGVRPATALALGAGCDLGAGGAIKVDHRMATSLPSVFAAGDCATTRHRLLGDDAYLPLGSTSHKQGRVAGANAVGGEASFAGVLGTQVVRVFDRVFARTGIDAVEATRLGFEPRVHDTNVSDRNPYFPGASNITLRLLGDDRSGQLLGSQIMGGLDAQVARRIDVFAAAIHAGFRVDEVADLDLSYSPPFGSPWDPVQVASLAWAQD